MCLWFTPGNRFCAENDVGTSISGHLRDRSHLVATGKDRRRALGFAKIEPSLTQVNNLFRQVES